MTLPPFYLTVLAPLEDIHEGDSTTEFVCGSHRVDLVASGLDSKEKLVAWCESQRSQGKVRSVALRAGSLCVFSGYVVHRGKAAATTTATTTTSPPSPSPSESSSKKMRPMVYAVCKKNWYNDEPLENYRCL